MFYPWCFFFFLSFFLPPTVLRAPSTDRPETLPPDRNLRVFYNLTPKILGALPPKNQGAKNMQNYGRFWTTSDFDREYLQNGWRYPKSADDFFLSFFRSPFSGLPRPIALKLCHLIGICVYFIIPLQKFGGRSPKKIRGPKTCKITVDFGPL